VFRGGGLTPGPKVVGVKPLIGKMPRPDLLMNDTPLDKKRTVRTPLDASDKMPSANDITRFYDVIGKVLPIIDRLTFKKVHTCITDIIILDVFNVLK